MGKASIIISLCVILAITLWLLYQAAHDQVNGFDILIFISIFYIGRMSAIVFSKEGES